MCFLILNKNILFYTKIDEVNFQFEAVFDEQ